VSSDDVKAVVDRFLAEENLKTYAFMFPGPPLGSRKTVQDFFSSRPLDFANWISNFEGTVLVVSPRTLRELREIFHTQFPAWFFMISEVKKDEIDGWMPANIWDFIQNPKPAIDPLGLPPKQAESQLNALIQQLVDSAAKNELKK